jgi:predicted nucleic acid-binding protein
MEGDGAGLAAMLTANRKELSLVDCVSFEVMRRRDVTRAFALDTDFASQGFLVTP